MVLAFLSIERCLEETLVYVGANRVELKKVLLHYQDDSYQNGAEG